MLPKGWSPISSCRRVTERARVLEGSPSLEVRATICSLSARVSTGGTTTEQFEDEIHPRLRFAHRGLVAMANNGAKNSNDSQFFITLGASFLTSTRVCFFAELSVCVSRHGVDRADELHGKHTLFGRCGGETIYRGETSATARTANSNS